MPFRTRHRHHCRRDAIELALLLPTFAVLELRLDVCSRLVFGELAANAKRQRFLMPLRKHPNQPTGCRPRAARSSRRRRSPCRCSRIGEAPRPRGCSRRRQPGGGDRRGELDDELRAHVDTILLQLGEDTADEALGPQQAERQGGDEIAMATAARPGWLIARRIVISWRLACCFDLRPAPPASGALRLWRDSMRHPLAQARSIHDGAAGLALSFEEVDPGVELFGAYEVSAPDEECFEVAECDGPVERARTLPRCGADVCHRHDAAVLPRFISYLQLHRDPFGMEAE